MDNRAKGCQTTVAAAVLIWVIIFLFSCTPRMSAILTEGDIIDIEEGRTLVLFKDYYGNSYFRYEWLLNTRTDTLTKNSYVEIVFKERRDGKEVGND